MTREEIIDLLTLSRVFDNSVTVGKPEVAAWFLALNRLPFWTAQQAVIQHYTAPVEPGGNYPRIAPGHIMAYHLAHHRPDDQPPPAIRGPQADPAHIARCRAEIDAVIHEAAARFAPEEDPNQVPRWRPGTDKQELARRQAETSRLLRERGAVS